MWAAKNIDDRADRWSATRTQFGLLIFRSRTDERRDIHTCKNAVELVLAISMPV